MLTVINNCNPARKAFQNTKALTIQQNNLKIKETSCNDLHLKEMLSETRFGEMLIKMLQLF